MKTFLVMLRLAFWTNPLQRVLTCLTAVFVLVEVPRKLWPMYIVIADYLRDESWGQGGEGRRARLADFLRRTIYQDDSHWLVILMTVACLLMAGVYWRIASAPRIVQLAPHGRTRMLGSVMGVVVLSALVPLAIRG